MDNETVEHIPHVPFTSILVGCSGSGKTTFYINLLLNWDKIFDVPIGKLIIVYGFYQKVYESLKDAFGEKCVLAQDLCEEMLENENTDECVVLVLDDVAHRLCDNEVLVQAFIGGSHHNNLVCLFVTQNLFASRSANYLTIQRNAKFLFLFQLPRDKSSISVLGRQLFPDKNGGQILSQAYTYALDDYAVQNPDGKSYGYLMVDCQVSCPDHLRLRTGLLPTEKSMLYCIV